MGMSLAEALPLEISRVVEIIVEYKKYPAGNLAAAVMQANVDNAMKSMVEGDVVKMLQCYEELKQWEL